jgi:four helix bundle protein
MKENVIKSKSIAFSIRIVKLFHYLVEKKKEFIISNQLFRSGTSIGANIFEAENGQSDADFISKLEISQKEANETLYWLILLHETQYITDDQFDNIYSDAEEIKNS